LDAAILLHSRLARNNAGGNHCRYDPLSSGDLNPPHDSLYYESVSAPFLDMEVDPDA
jgi:hypothetical protein